MFSRRALTWALSFIFLANFFNYMDRSLVSALEEQISGALGLETFEFGLLWTLFTIGYMVCAVPIGLLADRYSRPKIFAVCVVIWSVATIASGLAEHKYVLYAARIFIGVGEAGCLVIGPSLLSDYFSRTVRARALSIFFLGMPLGGTAAYIVAGLLLDIGWRNLFFVAGAPGFAIAAVIWFLKDPPRGGSEKSPESEAVNHTGEARRISEGLAPAPSHSGEEAVQARSASEGIAPSLTRRAAEAGPTESPLVHGHGGGSFKEYAKLLRIPTLILVILAQAFAVIILVPLMHYGVGFFEKARQMDAKEARVLMGLIALIAGGLGNVLSGLLGDRLFKRTKAAYVLIAGVGYLAAFPCLYVGFTASDKTIFVGALGLGAFFIFLCMPAVNAQIANVSPPAQRATAWALAVMILHLLGDTLSPPLFGHLIGEWKSEFNGDENLAREKAFVWFTFAMIPAALCCFIATFTASRDTDRASASRPTGP